ncbi:unnamed protein product [Peronospora effusa]|uniref:Uncharacterized protein n=1 Tax=Peronospora effusa TaxID=542832 RepID=A0A3M6VA41_9STRA|nr:hypothetical protein DD238_006439 [Peronospora effusa]RQM13187.1 hypothetical protein DD237_005614 [Peronospora effusa]CAI5703372.1 unnamed protein product [Peronospora effusa]
MKWIDTIEDNSQLDEILVKEWFFEKKTLHFVEDLEKKVVKKRTEEIIEKDFNVDEELKKVKEHRWTYMYGKKVTNALNEIILKLQEPRSHTNINLGEDVALEKEKKVLEDILGFNE